MQSKTFLPSSFQNDEKWAQLLIRQRETLLWTLQAMLGSCVTCLPKCKPKSVLQSQRWSLPQGDPVIKAFKPLRPGLPRGHSKRLDSRLHSKGQRKGQANQGALYQTGGWTTSLPPSNFHITDGPSTQDNKKKKKTPQMLLWNKHTQDGYCEDQCRPCSFLSTPSCYIHPHTLFK